MCGTILLDHYYVTTQPSPCKLSVLQIYPSFNLPTRSSVSRGISTNSIHQASRCSRPSRFPSFHPSYHLYFFSFHFLAINQYLINPVLRVLVVCVIVLSRTYNCICDYCLPCIPSAPKFFPALLPIHVIISTYMLHLTPLNS